MYGSQLHKLARRLREVALTTTGNDDDDRLSAGELAIIEDVADHPATAIGEVAARTQLAQSMVSKTVALLREAGVFVTERDPQDRRRSLISIEPATRIHLFRDRGARSIAGALGQALPRRTPQEIVRALELLEELAAIFEERGTQENGKAH